MGDHHCLTGDVSEQALIFVHGDGGNGKTVFVNAITGAMGEYACTAASAVGEAVATMEGRRWTRGGGHF